MLGSPTPRPAVSTNGRHSVSSLGPGMGRARGNTHGRGRWMGAKLCVAFTESSSKGQGVPAGLALPACQRRHLTHPRCSPAGLPGGNAERGSLGGQSHLEHPWGTATFRASKLEGPPRTPPQPPSGKVPGEATQGAALATLGGPPSAQVGLRGEAPNAGSSSSRETAGQEVRTVLKVTPGPGSDVTPRPVGGKVSGT